MTAYTHLDEARSRALEALEAELERGDVERAVLIDDLFGKLRVVLWATPGHASEELTTRVAQAMRTAGQQFWTGVVWVASGANAGTADRLLYERAWDQGRPVTERLRIDDRHRTRTAWFAPFRSPPWEPRRTPQQTEAPPIVASLSFKGGLGRTTALAAFAIQRARAGERVAVIDFDLDAPGVGTLLGADERGLTAAWGVVDYLLERLLGDVPLDDYVHRCPQQLAGDGAILVIPAGRVDEHYLTKLARVDLELGAAASSAGPPREHPLALLFEQVRRELSPAWILIDARAGLSPAAGLLTSGFAHLYVLFGTTNEQSFIGLERVVHRLGAERLRSPDAGPSSAQAECVVVHAMVPENPAVAEKSREVFCARLEDIFRDHYLAESDPSEELWSVADIGNNAEAPFIPVPLPYSQRIAFFTSVAEIADALCSDPYAALSERIQGRFPLMTLEGE